MVGYKKQSRTLLVLALSLLLGAQTCMPIIPQSWDAMIDHVCDKAWEFKGSTAILTGLATIACVRSKKMLSQRAHLTNLTKQTARSQERDRTILEQYQNSVKNLEEAVVTSNTEHAQAQAQVTSIDTELSRIPQINLDQNKITQVDVDLKTVQQDINELNAQTKTAQEESDRLQQLIQQCQQEYMHTFAEFKKYLAEQNINPDATTISEDAFLQALRTQKEAIRTLAAPINIALKNAQIELSDIQNHIDTVVQLKQQLIPLKQKLNNYSLRAQENFMTIMTHYYITLGKNLFDQLNLDTNCTPWITQRLVTKLTPNFEPTQSTLVNQLFSHAIYKENYLAWATNIKPTVVPTEASFKFSKELQNFERYLDDILQDLGNNNDQ